MSINTVINFIGFQSVWLISVFSAANAYPWAGPLAVICWLAVHLYLNKNDIFLESMLVLFAASMGYLLDSILVLTSVISFPSEAQLGYLSPLWMVALWINLATTVRHSLDWLNNRYKLMTLFGGVGGVMAYWAGVKIGAILIPDLALGLFVVFSVWCVALPLLYMFANKLSERINADVTTGSQQNA
ncbi:MAG: DUF2878 domain-containing protein [Pseudomonadota bacterium]